MYIHDPRSCTEDPVGPHRTQTCQNCGMKDHTSRDCAANPKHHCPLCDTMGHNIGNCPAGKADKFAYLEKLKEGCVACRKEDHKFTDAECEPAGMTRAYLHLVHTCNKAANTCRICKLFGHPTRACKFTKECLNCGEPRYVFWLGVTVPRTKWCRRHTEKGEKCGNPEITRCGTCKSTEHEYKDCKFCGMCKKEAQILTDDHDFFDCPRRPCKNCGATGHMKSTCPDSICFICKQKGHLKNGCPSVRCRICEAQSHSTENCPQAHCDLCGQEGHLQAACPERLCDVVGCGGKGHSFSGFGDGLCPNAVCYKCLDTGHKARDCADPPKCQSCNDNECDTDNCDQGKYTIPSKEHS